ncbi:hypothetical protein AB0C96_36420 [Streptomyces sp. NPDC048506]|uniref:hypothetical protein n=1 Tax=Streptomyces sp. NPDC048506 TaxID=3155028 RepID=UPI00342F791C
MKTGQRQGGRTAAWPAPFFFIATGCVLLADVVSWSSVLLVVAGLVIPGWLVSSALLFVLLVLVLVRAVMRRTVASEAAKRRSLPTRLAFALMAGAAGLGSALGAVSDLGADYRILEPQGPDGCRAVTREVSFLFAGSGDVYAVGASGIGWRTSSWTADDGGRPIATGSYTLHWGLGGGVLTVSGSAGNPVWPSLHDVDCG